MSCQNPTPSQTGKNHTPIQPKPSSLTGRRRRSSAEKVHFFTRRFSTLTPTHWHANKYTHPQLLEPVPGRFKHPAAAQKKENPLAQTSSPFRRPNKRHFGKSRRKNGVTISRERFSCQIDLCGAGEKHRAKGFSCGVGRHIFWEVKGRKCEDMHFWRRSVAGGSGKTGSGLRERFFCSREKRKIRIDFGRFVRDWRILEGYREHTPFSNNNIDWQQQQKCETKKKHGTKVWFWCAKFCQCLGFFCV